MHCVHVYLALLYSTRARAMIPSLNRDIFGSFRDIFDRIGTISEDLGTLGEIPGHFGNIWDIFHGTRTKFTGRTVG